MATNQAQYIFNQILAAFRLWLDQTPDKIIQATKDGRMTSLQRGYQKTCKHSCSKGYHHTATGTTLCECCTMTLRVA